MSFLDIVGRAKAYLREHHRVSLRALQREFALDAETLAALLAELVDVQQVAERTGEVLISTAANSASASASPTTSTSTPNPLPSGERRQLTVLFCDLVGSTEIAAGMDAEDWRDVVAEYHRTVADVIARFGGHVAKNLGDGALVLFGYPQAHEDDAERAVRAGLAVSQGVKGLGVTGLGKSDPATPNPVTPNPLSVRIGIHTGPVVVDSTGEIFGDTVNVAARLQAVAAPDTVIISAATLRLVQGVFLIEELGPQNLKGIEAAVAAYRVVRPSGVRSRLDVAAAAGLTPLVGREQELGLLVDRWEQVREGTGQAVLVAGEAGIGKSRLVDSFRQRLSDEPHVWLECRCSPYTQDSALFPVIDLLHQTLAVAHDASRAEKLAQLEGALAFVGFPLAEAFPLLASFLSLPLPDGYAMPNLSPEGQRKKTLAILCEWLLRLAHQQSFVLLVEDLHWVDPSTLELLGMVLEQVPTASVLVLYTHRPDFRPPWPSRSHVTPLLLARLTRANVRQMVSGVVRERRIPETWVREIVRRTDGVPLFVEELTRTLLESELFEHETDETRLNDALGTLAIPATLHDSLTARLDALGPVKEIAQLAACLGREFDFGLLLAVSPLKEAELETMLAKAVEAEVFYQRGTLPEASFLFKHSLIQEAAYQSLLRATRQRHHRRIAETLERRFPEIVETRPELIAYHFAEGSEANRAVDFLHRAGQRGIGQSALTEAVRHLRRALALLEMLPSDPARDIRELALQTLLGLGVAATEGYGSPQVERAFGRADELCRALGDSEALFPVLFGHWAFRMARADAQAELETAERLQALAQVSDKDDLILEAHLALGITLYWRGAHARARVHLERVLALYDPDRHGGHAFVYGQDPAAYAATVLQELLWITGAPDRARRMEKRALAAAQRTAHPFTTAGILGGFLVASAAHRGDFAGSLDRAARARSICDEQGFPMVLGLCTFFEGYALLRSGRTREGLQGLRDGLAAVQATGSLVARTNHLCQLADACRRVGETARGLAALGEAVRFTEEHHERYWEPEIHRLRGELLLQEGGDAETPEQCFQHALGIAREMEAKSFELRAATSLARLWQQQSKHVEAHALLAPVYDWFTEGYDTQDLKDAKALLEELGS